MKKLHLKFAQGRHVLYVPWFPSGQCTKSTTFNQMSPDFNDGNHDRTVVLAVLKGTNRVVILT